MPFGLDFKLTGSREVAELLKRVPRKLRRRTLTKALSAAGGVIKEATKLRTPKETGLLRRSLRVNRARAGKGMIAYRVAPKSQKKAVYRTRKGTTRAAGTRTVQKLTAAGDRVRYRNPVTYAHLVELDHKKRGGGITRGLHFMRRSFRAAKTRAMAAIIRKIKDGINQAAAGGTHGNRG